MRPILDAGCGTGLNLRHLPEGSVGVDINPRNVALLRQRLPNHTVIEGDVEALPFDDASFGTVLCTEVIEHIPIHRRHSRIPPRPPARRRPIGSVPARSAIWKLRFLSSTCPHSEPFHNEYLPRGPRDADRLAGRALRYSLLHFNVLFVARRRD